MNRYNRKSYLGPVPPKSLKDKEKEKEREKEKEEKKQKRKEKEKETRPAPPPKPASRPRPHHSPASGEIQIANDVPSQPRSNYAPSNPSAYPSRVRSPLDHLALETKEDDRNGRPNYSSNGNPPSSLDVPARPQMGTRSASSSNMRSRAALHNTTLPIRAAPAPNGSSSGTPVSGEGGGSSWRRVYGN